MLSSISMTGKKRQTLARPEDKLTRSDLQLLHEALAYARKRSYRQASAVRVQGVLERVEELLLAPESGRRSLRLSPPEQEVIEREVPIYCDALTQRGGTLQGVQESERLRWIVTFLTGARDRTSWWRRLIWRR